MFMTTANVLETIQPGLRDRMEIISLSGYTEEEKLEIAKRHLLPKQIEENGLDKADVKFDRKALQNRRRVHAEAGLRQLEREIGKNLPQSSAQKSRRRR
jgi:ATP-dependent Lon protease